MNKQTIRDIKWAGKKALVRVDLNVPQDANGAVTDDSRARAIVPTVKKILAGGGSVVLMSHLGRPKGKPVPEMSLAPVAPALSKLLGAPVAFAADCVGEAAEKAVAAIRQAGGRGADMRNHAQQRKHAVPG